jgi:hypothetical protein
LFGVHGLARRCYVPLGDKCRIVVDLQILYWERLDNDASAPTAYTTTLLLQ